MRRLQPSDAGEFSWHVHVRRPKPDEGQFSFEILVARARSTESAGLRLTWSANLSHAHAGRESEQRGGVRLGAPAAVG